MKRRLALLVPLALALALTLAASAHSATTPRVLAIRFNTEINPVTRMIEAGRGFLAGNPTEVGLAFAAAAALALGFSLWALRGLRSAEAAG